MIRIEFDPTVNPNYVATKWVEETPTSSAMLGRLYLPKETFEMLITTAEPMDIKFVERIPL